MSVNAVSRTGCYYAPNFQCVAKINPRRDSVFVDPRTGEKTTIRPGIYDPEADRKVSKGKKLLLALLFGGAAFLFRGKLKAGWELVKGFAKKAFGFVGKLFKK